MICGMRYETNCVDCPGPNPGEAIRALVDSGRDVTRRAFLRRIDRDELRALERELGYEAHPSRGLTMAGDRHVGYSLGEFRGRPAAFLTWSAIEYIFTSEAS